MRDVETHILGNIYEDMACGISPNDIVQYYSEHYSVFDATINDGIIHARIYLPDENRWAQHDIKIQPPRTGKNYEKPTTTD